MSEGAAVAAAAAARREARRRRILDGSSERLQRITGKPRPPGLSPGPAHAESPALGEASSSFELPEFPTLSVLSKHQHNGSVHPADVDSLDMLHEAPDLQDFLKNITGESREAAAAEPAPTAWERISLSKLDIIIISIVVQIVYAGIEAVESLSLFLPLFVYNVTKLVLLPRRKQGGILSTLLVMKGVSPDRAHTIIHVSQLFTTFIQDVFLYLFVTVCTQSLFSYFIYSIPRGI